MPLVELQIIAALPGIASGQVISAASTAVALGGFSYAIMQWLANSRRKDRQRINARLIAEVEQHQENSPIDDAQSLVRKGQTPRVAGGTLLGTIARFQPVARLQRLCVQADLEWNAARVLLRLALGAGVTTAMLWSLGLSPPKSILAGALVLSGPVIYVMRKRTKRLKTLVEQLPDAFDMIAQALRAGQSLSSAVGMTAEQLGGPIGKEFSLVYQEQQLGVPLEDALSNFRHRLDQMDIAFFVTAVQIQRQSGGDLAEVLDRIGAVIRDRSRIRGQIMSLTAEGRLSGWVLLALPVVMLIAQMFLNPVYANTLFETEVGYKMLVGAGVMQLIGLLVIRKIVNIKI